MRLSGQVHQTGQNIFAVGPRHGQQPLGPIANEQALLSQFVLYLGLSETCRCHLSAFQPETLPFSSSVTRRALPLPVSFTSQPRHFGAKLRLTLNIGQGQVTAILCQRPRHKRRFRFAKLARSVVCQLIPRATRNRSASGK